MMDCVQPLHQYIALYRAEGFLAFGAAGADSALVIDRQTAQFGLQSTWPQGSRLRVALDAGRIPPPQTVYGIIGTIRLRLGIIRGDGGLM
jgi:hypothetical protein